MRSATTLSEVPHSGMPAWVAWARSLRRTLRWPARIPRRGLLALAAALLVEVLLASSPALANSPMSSGLESFGAKVSDEQLSDMRGKFVRPENVSYFGISMATSWQNSDEVTTSAVLLFSVSFLHGANGLSGANPVVAVAWNRDCDSCGDPAMDVIGFGPAAQNDYVAVTSAAQLVPWAAWTRSMAPSRANRSPASATGLPTPCSLPSCLLRRLTRWIRRNCRRFRKARWKPSPTAARSVFSFPQTSSVSRW